ncbi:uncharacterized protein LTR77_006182 [Saxophila tyrrhenica]|uniref:Cutinase n=1 Tax=Saxophila tyrrhenica TaxID=1690608 RepID=A0AAV9P808_9PEZI|nr:hypothetical protein LTR77_006182 [Saxophila tyrrhenica]
MKLSSIALSFAAAAVASPIGAVEKRQLSGITENELSVGSCRDVVFIFARGSTEPATIGANLLPQGTTTAAIREAQRLFQLANSKCPNSVVTAGGYSQGAAVMTGAVSGLSASVKAQVAGVVLYGNTRQFETGGRIPNYPQEDTLIFCNRSDGVCSAGLTVTPGHLTYNVDVPEAADFLVARVAAA